MIKIDQSPPKIGGVILYIGIAYLLQNMNLGR